MRVVIQRVSEAAVIIRNHKYRVKESSIQSDGIDESPDLQNGVTPKFDSSRADMYIKPNSNQPDYLKTSIGNGMLVLLGIETADNEEDIEWLCSKIVQLRIFNDEEDVMNLSVKDIDGEILVVSQFTLHASTRKGNRPSYIKAARPELAIPLYEQFCALLTQKTGKMVQTGEFGADMQVQLTNEGPVTILMDSKNRE